MSLPVLACPYINNIKGVIAAGHLRGQAGPDALAKAAADCRASLTAQGIDLNAYTSAQTADDIDDLRKALGIAQWNLFGHSYGTRLALTVLRDHPEGVRSVLLDSVLPPEVNFDESASANLKRALNGVFDTCAVTVACRTAYPGLPQDFTRLIAQADAHPLDIKPVVTGSDGEPVVVGGAEIVDAIYSVLHSPDDIVTIPRLIEDSLHGKTDELAKWVASNQGPSGFTWGLRLSVWCGEEMPFENPAMIEDQILPAWGLGGIDERTASVAMCKAWSVAPADAREALPVTSDVPVLVLSGAFDPDTPPDWGRGLIAHLSNARVVLFAGQSHGAGFNRCGAEIETAFLRDPKAPVAADCSLKMRGADFAAAAGS